MKTSLWNDNDNHFSICHTYLDIPYCKRPKGHALIFLFSKNLPTAVCFLLFMTFYTVVNIECSTFVERPLQWHRHIQTDSLDVILLNKERDTECWTCSFLKFVIYFLWPTKRLLWMLQCVFPPSDDCSGIADVSDVSEKGSFTSQKRLLQWKDRWQ